MASSKTAGPLAKFLKLSKEQQTQIIKTLRILHDLIPQLDQLRQAGVDVEEMEAERLRLVDQFTKIKEAF